MRGGVARPLAVAIALSAISGATAGLLPAVIGAAVNALLGRSASAGSGLGRVFASLVAGASAPAVILAAFAATLATVAVSVTASRRGSELSGELTAALRVELLRAVLHASARDVEDAGREAAAASAKGAPPMPAPPGAKAPPAVRGVELVKLSIARESGLVADFAVALLGGLPQAAFTLGVLAWELLAGGAGVVLAGAALLFALSRVVADRASRRVGREMQGMQRADAAVFSGLGEMLAATEDLRLLGARREAVAELATAAYACSDARRRFTGALAVSGQIKSVFSAISPLLILVALQISNRAADTGEVAKLLLVVPLLMARFEALDGLRAGSIERGPLLRATANLLALPPAPPADPDPVPASDITSGAIELERVTFTPKGAVKPVLDGLSLSIPEGALVGICGRSGSGKSTLLRLLLRLDDPDGGRVTVGGIDVRRIAPDELPRVFAVLGQASRLLERSIAQNLVLGLDDAPPDDRLRDALRRVDLAELADPAGARGLATEFHAVPPSFSGGEQRRLLLARMLLRDARVLVLDEPESGLPSATAEELLRGVAEVAKGRTCVVVTHAPHLLRSTFNVVIDGGAIAAIGTHEELAATSELYRSLLAEGLKGGRALAGAPR